MMKKVWDLIKDNATAIITIMTAVVAVVYALLKLCVYVYWKAYFAKLNIDENVMSINFDKTIYSVVFVSVISFVVVFFVRWICHVLIGFKMKSKELSYKGIRKFGQGLKLIILSILISSLLLAIVNVPLAILLLSSVGMVLKPFSIIFWALLLYILEMIFVIIYVITAKSNEIKVELNKNNIIWFVVELLAFVFIFLAGSYYSGSTAVDKKTTVQLVENDEYMISYSNGDCLVLHKVECDGDEIVVYINEQKIIKVENYEVSVKQINKIDIK